MTQEEKQQVIAQLLGYKEFHRVGKYLHGWKTDDKDEDSTIVPDFFNDLNACLEAAQLLSYEQAEEFEDHLCDICKRANDMLENPSPWRFAVVNATAPQRAEALYRTLCNK